MTCKPIHLGGITAIVCSLGRAPQPAPCSVPGCGKPHSRLCDFPLTGRKAGQTCSRKLCESCACYQGDGFDYCPAHDALARERASVADEAPAQPGPVQGMLFEPRGESDAG